MDGKSIRNKLIGDEQERAVSPVIGVILMVAITVILAAVIAAFVLDLGQSQSRLAREKVSQYFLMVVVLLLFVGQSAYSAYTKEDVVRPYALWRSATKLITLDRGQKGSEWA